MAASKVVPEDFDILRFIGSGYFGQVFQVRKRSGSDANKVFAMKVIKKKIIVGNPTATRHTQTERNVLERVKHPFIADLKYACQTDSKLYFVLEFMGGGELFMLMEREKFFYEDVARFYLAELTLALDHLHSLDIIYRDLKPMNVMMDREGHVKLVDFGLSRENFRDDKLATTFCGTVEYMAPEMHQRTGHGKEVDWWGLGILAYDMLCGRPPFGNDNSKKTIDKILKGSSALSFPKFITEDAIDLCRKLLRRNPNQRLGNQGGLDVQRHKFFANTDWHLVYSRRLEPPFKPKLKTDDDVSLFDPEFLNNPAIDNEEDAVQGMDFAGFSFISESDDLDLSD